MGIMVPCRMRNGYCLTITEDTAIGGTDQEEKMMHGGQKLVIIGRGGAGGPAAILAKKLMPQVEVTIVGEEDRFIVR